jgi:hypothetical protein
MTRKKTPQELELQDYVRNNGGTVRKALATAIASRDEIDATPYILIRLNRDGSFTLRANGGQETSDMRLAMMSVIYRNIENFIKVSFNMGFAKSEETKPTD